MLTSRIKIKDNSLIKNKYIFAQFISASNALLYRSRMSIKIFVLSCVFTIIAILLAYIISFIIRVLA